MAPKVAIITGGASGMGLAVSQALVSKGDWEVNILDMNAETGNEAAKKIGATFHQVNVTEYDSLATAFKNVFKAHRRIDFVHANAGIIERGNFYQVHDTGDEPPPPLSSLVVDIDLMSVIQTSYLAQHYFRQTPSDGSGPRCLIVTASCGGFYRVSRSPVYCSAKFGTVGWVRSIASTLWKEDGVRVNAICPGVVRTGLLGDEAWNTFPQEYFTPIEKVVEVVTMLLSSEGGKDSNGVEVGKPLIGQTVEISTNNHYFRQQHDYCDEPMKAVMGSTDM